MVGLRLLYDDAMLRHLTGPGHPERPERLAAVVEELQRAALPGAEWVSPGHADSAAITRIHRPEYVDVLNSVLLGSSRSGE